MPRSFEDRADASEPFPYDEVERRLSGEPALAEVNMDSLLEHPIARAFAAEAIRNTLRLIRADPYPRLQADCIVIAIGGDLREDGTSISMTEVARNHGITKAAVSKRVAKIRETFHLPTNRNLKSDESRRRYAATNSSPLNLGSRLAGGGCSPAKRN